MAGGNTRGGGNDQGGGGRGSGPDQGAAGAAAAPPLTAAAQPANMEQLLAAFLQGNITLTAAVTALTTAEAARAGQTPPVSPAIPAHTRKAQPQDLFIVSLVDPTCQHYLFSIGKAIEDFAILYRRLATNAQNIDIFNFFILFYNLN